MLYASTRTANGNLDSSIGTDYVVKINPATGIASTFFAGPTNLNGGVNPTFLLFTTVPEPGTLALAIVGGMGTRRLVQSTTSQGSGSKRARGRSRVRHRRRSTATAQRRSPRSAKYPVCELPALGFVLEN